MELSEVIAQRRMVRSFADRGIDPGLVDALLRDARRSPTAGNTGGTAWIALATAEETAVYWEHTTTGDWRAWSPRWPGLSRAPVVALSVVSPDAYLDRYAEADKGGSGLGRAGPGDGGGEEAWPVPYWFGDAAFSTLALLLRATDEGLGACFLGNFRGERSLLAALSVPSGWRLFGSVLLGYPDGTDRRSSSLERRAPARADRVHHGRWQGPGQDSGKVRPTPWHA